MKKEKYMSWDTYFMSIAILSSFRSKDPKFQNGACIASSENKVIAIGGRSTCWGQSNHLPDRDPSTALAVFCYHPALHNRRF